MEEIRIDVTKQTPEELALAAEHAQLIFRFNHTMPGTTEYDELMHRIFPRWEKAAESCHHLQPSDPTWSRLAET